MIIQPTLGSSDWIYANEPINCLAVNKTFYNRIFHEVDEIGNNVNIGIRVFTT